jgi:kumamolisin
LILRLNQGLGKNVGYLTPKLYQPRWTQNALRNITLGNNSMGDVQGYSAGPGWNAVTGWGSPNGRALLEALRAGTA